MALGGSEGLLGPYFLGGVALGGIPLDFHEVNLIEI